MSIGKGLISKEIQEEAEYWRIPIEKLPTEQGDKIKYSIRQKYINDGIEHNWTFLWEHLIDDSCVSDYHGWELVCDFVGREYCLIFFCVDEEEDVFLIKNGRDLFKIIEQGDSFREFYITNFETNYLLGFSHEETLHGCGIAKRWVDSLKNMKHHEEIL